VINSLKGKRIAIIEDDVVNLAVFATVLRKAGAILIQDNFTADPVKKLLGYQKIDLILLDLLLRYEQDGYSVFETLQATPELKGIPVVAISSLDPATEIPKLKAKGFSGFISKPVNVNNFTQQLLDTLSGQSVWTTGR